MIPAPNENGSAEAATSPSHGSNNPGKESAVNTQSHSTTPAGAASVPFDYPAAYSGLEELICTAQARGNVLFLLSDGLQARDKNSSFVRVPVHQLDSLLFMIEEMCSAVSALDQQYKASWPAEAASIVGSLKEAKEFSAARKEEEGALAGLIRAHRVATIDYDAAVVSAGELDAPSGAAALVEAKEAQWEAASAALLSWRPSSFAGNADRIRYLTDPRLGPWRGSGPTSEELTMLFASMVEAGNGQ